MLPPAGVERLRRAQKAECLSWDQVNNIPAGTETMISTLPSKDLAGFNSCLKGRTITIPQTGHIVIVP
jgi:hypothetical protein